MNRESMGGALLAVIAAIVAIVIGGAVILAGWQAGWWFTVANAKRQIQVNNIQAHGIQAGFAAQSGLLTDFNNAYTEITGMGAQIAQAAQGGGAQPLIDQRLAIANKACADASQITISVGPADRAWIRANCAGPTVKASSSLRKGS